MAPQSDLVLVVGSVNSSNSNRLREVAETVLNVPAYLIDNAEAIDPAWIVGKQRIGVTAGASAPEGAGRIRHRPPQGAGCRVRPRPRGRARAGHLPAAQGTPPESETPAA